MADIAFLLRDRVERNYAAVMAGRYPERHAYVSQIPNTLGRHAEVALLDTIWRRRHVFGTLLGLELPEGTKYAGAGSLHTVIQNDTAVTKIHRRSAYLSEPGREAMRDEHINQHRLLRQYLGEMVVPQETTVGAHPLRAGWRAVRSEQPLVAFDNLNLFAAHQPEVSTTALELAKLDYPGIETALQDLAIGGLALYEATGLLVDTSGQNNIVVADGEVRCLDGLPIADGNAGDVRRITGQLTGLLQQVTALN